MAATKAGVPQGFPSDSRSGSDRSRPIATGRATKDVTLPESLTTYRIMAVAGDTASRFGSARRGDQSQQAGHAHRRVSALPDARRPRVVRRGRDQHAADRRRMPPSRFAVSIRRVLSNSARRRRQTVHARRRRDRTRCASTPSRASVGTARVQMTVRLGANTDAFEMTLPVGAPARLETNAAFGETDRSRDRTARRSRRRRCPARADSTSSWRPRRSSVSAKARATSPTIRSRAREQKASARARARARRRSRQRVQHGPHRAGRLPQARDGAA